MKTQGIYTIRHVASGRVYVGSAANVTRRWWLHRSELNNGVHHGRHLQAAWKKYGAAAFVFSVVEIVNDRANLIPREQWWIDDLKATDRRAGFNTCAVAGSPLGIKRSDETKAKLRAAWSIRPKDRAIALGQSSRGRILTPEHVAKMRAAALRMSPETKAKITAATMGHAVSQETRAKLSAANKGQVISQAQRAMISAFHKGKVMSAATRAKMSAARMGHVVSAETRAKLAANWTKKRADRLRSAAPGAL